MDQKKIRFLKTLSTWMVLAAMVFAFLIAGIRIFGVQVYGVLTGSMEPSYPTGSLIYVKPVDAADLRVNDVITFSISPGVIATHRIVEVVWDEQRPGYLSYRTKGDANKDVDAALVSANNIIGKAMFAIPQLGYVANYIQQAPGIYVAILVCGLMIAFVFYTDSLDEKQKKQEQQLMEDKPGFDPAVVINRLSQKLLGKDIIKPKAPPEPLGHQGYVPRQAPPQMVQYNHMPQQSYPQPYMQQGQYPQYPQQNYPTQMQQQPYYGAQQQYPQQYPPQGYPQQASYPAQGQPVPQMQQSQLYYQQQYYTQQSYGQQPYQYQQQNMPNPYTAPQNSAETLQQNQRSEPMQ